MPHVLVLDEAGTVLAAGNITEETMLMNMWRYAKLRTPSYADGRAADVAR